MVDAPHKQIRKKCVHADMAKLSVRNLLFSIFIRSIQAVTAVVLSKVH